MASSLRAFQTTLRSTVRANSASLRNRSPTALFSTAPHVVVDKYTSSPPVMTGRLPNNDRERNSLYDDEESRTMSNVTSTVRHDWTKSEIAAVKQ